MPLNSNKLKLIQKLSEIQKFKSFADLGGVWGVDAGYTFHLLDTYEIQKAVLVDDIVFEQVWERAKQYSQLSVIEGKFGEAKTFKQVPKVDLILLFDVLLHQVSPDWDAVIRKYCRKADYFCVYNQQWMGGATVRFPDMSEEDYIRHVQRSTEHPEYSKLTEIHPLQKKAWRDVHHIWQWGITDNDLIGCFDKCGFEPLYFGVFGGWKKLPNIENHGFIFGRR